jgi:hypothetical protein
MTTRQLDVLKAAVELWDETGHGVTASAIAARIGADEESVKRDLEPLATHEYFGEFMRGDDRVQVVREPTAAARRFLGP